MSGEEKGRSLKDQTQAFLQEFFTKGEELVRELIEENERLRGRISAYEANQVDSPVELIERLMKQIEELEAECAEIKRLAGSVERESGDYRQRLDTLEREHYHLAAMYVAGGQFHSAVTIDEVLRTTTEVLLNFVGVGRFTLYCVDEERQVLFPLLREGGDLADAPEIALPGASGANATPPALAAALRTAGPWKAGQPLGEGDGALMHLRLCSGTRLVGIARIESFLPQKNAFSDNDWSLLEMISDHSGIGIETAWIRAHAKEAPLQRRALEGLVVA